MLESTKTKKKSIGNDGATYPYDFKIWHESELRVLRGNITPPLDQQEGVLNTHFTVSGVGLAAGGQITCIGDWASPYPDDTEYITCLRGMPFTQAVDVENQGSPYGNTHEKAWDRIMAHLQQVKELFERCFRVAESSDEDPEDMTLDTVRNAPTDTSGFGGVLTASQNTIQKALDRVDDYAAPLASPALTDTPTAPTPSEQDGTTKIATCEYVDRASAILLAEGIADNESFLNCYAGADIKANHDILLLEFFGVRSYATASLLLRLLDGAGVPEAGNTYQYVLYGRDSDGNALQWNAEGASSCKLTDSQPGGGWYALGSIRSECSTAILFPIWGGQVNWVDTAGFKSVSAGCRFYPDTATTIGGFRLFFSSGNITGTARLWGLPKGS